MPKKYLMLAFLALSFLILPITATAAAKERTVTLADSNKKISLNVNDTLSIELGTSYSWSPIKLSNQKVFSHAPLNALLAIGVQAVLKAAAKGTVILTTVGTPACRQAKPACAAPSRLFKITVVVTAPKPIVVTPPPRPADAGRLPNFSKR